MADLNPTPNNVRFVSWNVKGLNKFSKMSRIMSHLQFLKADIAFLEETHLTPSDVPRLKRGWVGHLFHSNYSCKARGAAILIRKGIAFELLNSIVDPHGRYIIVSCTIENNPVVLACVYAPNWDDSQFISRFFSALPNLTNSLLILGGDWNLVQNTLLDRSSSKNIPLSAAAKSLSSYAGELGLSDPWRSRFPSTKTYSFFSHRHHTYSRIDFFLLDNRLLSKVISCEYHSMVISDHAPTSVVISLPRSYTPSRQWRFNSQMLSDDAFKEFLTTNIGVFFDINKTPDVSQAILWDSFKGYLRGQTISYISHARKLETAKLAKISEEILQLDEKYATAPTPALYNKRLHLQAELNLLTTKKTELLMLKSRQRFFETGDRAGKLLAHQARSTAASRLISKIKSPTGETLTDTRDINTAFLNFYSELYSSECSPDIWDLNNPLDNLNYPVMDASVSEDLGGPITLLEIHEAIQSMQNGKSPGPDGYTVEFYKTFSHLLSPILLELYNDSFQKGRLPDTLSQSCISLLLKKDKDPLLCGSRRPISLLNVDLKILSKILYNRLRQVVPDLISTDQTGFIYGRHSSSNTRRLLDVIHSPGSESPEFVLSLDAEKAFDRVEWTYLFYVLGKNGVQRQFHFMDQTVIFCPCSLSNH